MVSLLRVWQRARRLQVSYGAVWLLLMALPILVHAEQLTGTVVGISDGDTISVLREGKGVKVRLDGVDTPEKTQAFGTKARQCTAAWVFQKEVTIAEAQQAGYHRTKNCP
jgi:endonuclease YncB( thermonuclease family)